MKTLQTLIESNLPCRKVVEAALPPTVRTKPEYKGKAHVTLRVDHASGNGWSGVATVDGREIKITGPYGVQKKIPGLIVPAGVGRSAWSWEAIKEATDLHTNESVPLYFIIPKGATVQLNGCPVELEEDVRAWTYEGNLGLMSDIPEYVITKVD